MSKSSRPLSKTIEATVVRKSLLKHPFYRAWSAGALTHSQLAGYAKEYYFVAKSVPRIMAEVKKNLPATLSQTHQRTFERNALEESEHVHLWERFAKALGISKKQLEAYRPTRSVGGAIERIHATVKRGFEEGIAAMYAFEFDLPAISKTKMLGLRKFYELRSKDAHAYFEEHVREEKHLRYWRELLAEVTPAKRHPAITAARQTVDAQNRVLDGVVERYCKDMR